MNTGSGWTPASAVWNLPALPDQFRTTNVYPWYRGKRYSQTYFPDINGDGLPDLVQTARYSNPSFGDMSDFLDFEYINNGNGCTQVNAGNLKSINSCLAAKYPFSNFTVHLTHFNGE